MSSYRGNGEKCPHCGTTYGEFKTGLKYADVYLWFVSNDPDTSTWRYKRRHTILGKWHQHKKEQWKHHISEGCPAIFEPGDAFEAPLVGLVLMEASDVPF